MKATNHFGGDPRAPSFARHEILLEGLEFRLLLDSGQSREYGPLLPEADEFTGTRFASRALSFVAEKMEERRFRQGVHQGRPVRDVLRGEQRMCPEIDVCGAEKAFSVG